MHRANGKRISFKLGDFPYILLGAMGTHALHPQGAIRTVIKTVDYLLLCGRIWYFRSFASAAI